MEKMQLEIPKFLDDLNQACSKIESNLIAAEISEAEGGAPFVVVLSTDEFIKVADLLRPKVIYYETMDFDAKIALLSKARIDYEELFDEAEAENEEAPGSSEDHLPQNRRDVGLYAAEKFVSDRKTKQFLKKWESKNGTAFDVHVMFFANGVFHELKLTEQWFEKFDDERDELLQQHKAIYADTNSAIEVRLDKATEEMAKRLSVHPLFTSKGATKEKREYLAQQLFPEKRYGLYPQLVARAASILWYESGIGN